MDKIKILIVDDKKIIGDLFSFTLGYSGHNITVVNTSREAIDAVKKQVFDIAFIDIILPDRDGVAILQDVKNIVPQLPVIMMSGYSVEEKRLKAEELGAVTCLKKPFEMDDVRKIIKEVLGKDV